MSLIDDIRKKIRSERNRHGWTAEQLGDMVGLDGAAILHYETGRRGIRIEILERIAKTLGLNITDFLGIQPDSVHENIMKGAGQSLLKIPVFAGVPCGGFSTIDDTVIEYMSVPMEMVEGVKNPQLNVFWIVAKGESMMPKIKNGDRVLVANEFGAPIINGDLAVMVVGDQTTLKRIYEMNDSFNLIPENPLFPPMIKTKKELRAEHVSFYKVLGVFTSLL
ncbi:MAG: LexA family transcriptional regulator [Nitrospirae bacterium]|nr:LexA family transcriptional regulator [Nitrospirota bacterium]MBF0540578.1 LexA family transcriptional regulator [Nitrospirota bacterium]